MSPRRPDPPLDATTCRTCWCHGSPSPPPRLVKRSIERLAVHQDDLAEVSPAVGRHRLEAADLDQPAEVLRHDNVVSRAQMGSGHADGDRPDQLTGFREVVLPASDEGAEFVDVQVEHTEVIVHVHLGKR